MRHHDENDERILKLPKWARGLIKELKQDRDVAEQIVSEKFADNEKMAGWQDHLFYEDMLTRSLEQNRRIINANIITLENAGLRVSITPIDNAIRIAFDSADAVGQAALVPGASNSINIIKAPR